MTDKEKRLVPDGTRFTALDDFFSPELGSQYVKGLSYTVRPGDKKLAALVLDWVGEGKAEIGSLGTKVQGKG